MGEGEVLDAAGAAFAMLILTGKDALSRRVNDDADDLPVREISGLPGAARIGDILDSIGAKPVSLDKLLDVVATPDEREILMSLKIAAPWPRLMFLGSPGTEQDRLYSRLSDLENELWAEARSRLSSGEWAERGLPGGAHALVDIIPELWTHLVCNFWRNEAHDPISGIEFHHVTIRQLVSPAREGLDTTPGSLRRSVKTFLRGKAQSARSPIRKDDLLLEAKACVAPHVSRTMLDEVLVELKRAGKIPESLLFKGRPPLKTPGK